MCEDECECVRSTRYAACATFVTHNSRIHRGFECDNSNANSTRYEIENGKKKGCRVIAIERWKKRPLNNNSNHIACVRTRTKDKKEFIAACDGLELKRPNWMEDIYACLAV